ncbi:MAG: hypothetical protein KF862_14515 [Chitinophagaceae bacterium]|nr:hypothetical protein [Chitinophagaceae bacterium]
MKNRWNKYVHFRVFATLNFANYEHSSQKTSYSSEKSDRNYQFWKGDPLAIPLSTIKILEQKLEYIHNNPVVEKWYLARLPEEYRWSSANFYLNGVDEFGFLTHYKE